MYMEAIQFKEILLQLAIISHTFLRINLIKQQKTCNIFAKIIFEESVSTIHGVYLFQVSLFIGFTIS